MADFCKVLAWFGVALAGTLGLAAEAQDGASERDYLVDIDINYGFAYRDGSLVPIAVKFSNPRNSLQGWVEVRTYDVNGLQGPVYRRPIDAPKGSKKRFQLYCYLQGAERVEAQIYDGRRAVLPFPIRENTAPITPEDRLALVLDDDGAGLNFLYMAVNAGNDKRGLHRANIASDQLAYLPDYAQSYEGWDVIIMGKTQPENIGPRHRELIEDYVRRGGRLAVCVGANAKAYANTWVEELLGVTIGQAQAMKKRELAEAAFPGAATVRSATRVEHDGDCLVATLTPRLDDVKRLGAGLTVATRRNLGQGAVYAVAVDADSEVLALQDLAPYHELWREICTRTTSPRPLNFDAVGTLAAGLIPQISGIVIHSRASVMTYLALYFLVGIVGNWLFFNWLKRREWAWAMLIVFSLGFTSYAMIFGTTGRARISEIEQLDVVHVPVGGGRSSLTSIVGILTAHTSNYELDLNREYSLAFDAASPLSDFRAGYAPTHAARGTHSFRVVQGERPRIEDFRVGASELRLARIESEVETPGGIEGRLCIDSGGLKGTLRNATGHRLTRAWLLFSGHLFSVDAAGDTIDINIQPTQLQRASAYASFGTRHRNMDYGRYGGVGEDVALGTLTELFPTQLFLDDRASFYAPTSRMNGDSGAPLRTDVGPLLCGWSDGAPSDIVSVDGDVRTALAKTFIVAEVALAYSDSDLSSVLYKRRDVEVWALTAMSGERRGPFDDFGPNTSPQRSLNNEAHVPCGGDIDIAVLLPESVYAARPGDLEIDISGVQGAAMPRGQFGFEPRSQSVPPVEPLTQQAGATQTDQFGATFNQLTLHGWLPLLDIDPQSETLALRVEPGRLRPTAIPQTGISPFRESEPVTGVLQGRLKHVLTDQCHLRDPHTHRVFLSGRVKLPVSSQYVGDALPWQ